MTSPAAHAVPPEKRPLNRADDDLPGDLPPIDDDGVDRETDPDLLRDDELPEDDGGDPFDDATGEADAAPELSGEGEDGGSLLDAGPSDDLDIGAADLVGEESDRLLDDGNGEDAPLEDYGLRDDASATSLDAGEEGPSTIDESLTDEGLPPLDQDDDGALDDAMAFFDGDLAAGRRDAWSSLWERFGAPLSLPPVRSLARSAAGVVGAGRELVRVDLEGEVVRLAAKGLRGGDATRVLLVGSEAWVTTDAGGLFVSRDDGGTFVEVSGWRELVRPEEAAAGLDVAASVEEGLWGRTAQGSILSTRDSGERWVKADVDGFVRAVAMDDEGRPALLVRALGASEVHRRVEGAWTRAALPGEWLEHGLTAPASLVARGNAVAIAVEGEGVLRSLDGAAWSRIAGTEAVTAMAMLDAAGTLVVALSGGEGDPKCSLLRVGADGEPKVVAVWEERSEGEAGVTAIAVDEAHQVVWVGGGFGVAAFQPRMRA